MKFNVRTFYYGCIALLLSLSMATPWIIETLMNRMETCRELPQYGTCMTQFRKWYYVPKLRKCQPFIYSSCGGNGNQFYNKRECEEYCNIVSGSFESQA